MPAQEKRSFARILVASTAGTVVEWYDFFIYAIAATLVFNKVFFSQLEDPLIAVSAALATYAVGFLARPLGGIVFGHFGDRLGRKRLLQVSLIIIGVATVGIGLLPTYAQIGGFAPLLLVLLRFAQGFALGGEWGGAILLVGEHGHPKHRGLWTSFPQAAIPMGNLLGTGVMALLSTLLSEEAFISWGWRVAFWASGLIIIVGYFIRRTVDDAPIFKETLAKVQAETEMKAPIRLVLRYYWRQALLGTLIVLSPAVLYYMVVSFSIVYLDQIVGTSTSTILSLMFVAHLVHLFVGPLAGALSDRIGRKPVIAVGLAGGVVWSIFAWSAYGTGAVSVILTTLCLGLVAQGLLMSTTPALLTELFPTALRYTGISVPYQVANTLGGGFSPFIATSLLALFGAALPVTLFMSGVALVSGVALAMVRETRGVVLDDLDERILQAMTGPSSPPDSEEQTVR